MSLSALNKRVFQDWVECYGEEKLAKRLGVTKTTVVRWTKRQGWPKVSLLTKIVKLSNGLLTYENIIESTSPRNRK